MPTPAENFYNPQRRRPSPCTVCDNPDCDGKLNELRHFTSWRDLSEHLDEETIVTFINRFAQIADEYMELHAAAHTQRLKRQAYQQERNALIQYAKRKMAEEAEKPAIQSTGKGGKVLHITEPK